MAGRPLCTRCDHPSEEHHPSARVVGPGSAPHLECAEPGCTCTLRAYELTTYPGPPEADEPEQLMPAMVRFVLDGDDGVVWFTSHHVVAVFEARVERASTKVTRTQVHTAGGRVFTLAPPITPDEVVAQLWQVDPEAIR